jgi:hypothetical protein
LLIVTHDEDDSRDGDDTQHAYTMASTEALSQVNGNAPAPTSAAALKELTGGKPIKSKNQLRRLKQKQKKAIEATATPEPAVSSPTLVFSRSHVVFVSGGRGALNC